MKAPSDSSGRPGAAIRRAKVPGAFLALAAAGACSSLPQTHYFAPEISGVILQDRRPVANARVRLTAALTSQAQFATTDESGRFNVGPLTNYQFTLKQFGVAHFDYALQIAVEGQAYPAYAAQGEGDAPRRVSLRCQLEAPAAAGGGAASCETTGD